MCVDCSMDGIITMEIILYIWNPMTKWLLQLCLKTNKSPKRLERKWRLHASCARRLATMQASVRKNCPPRHPRMVLVWNHVTMQKMMMGSIAKARLKKMSKVRPFKSLVRTVENLAITNMMFPQIQELTKTRKKMQG